MKKLGKNFWTVTGKLEDLKVVAVGNEKIQDKNKRMQIQRKIIIQLEKINGFRSYK